MTDRDKNIGGFSVSANDISKAAESTGSSPEVDDRKKRVKRAQATKNPTIAAEIKADPFVAALQKQALEVPTWTREELQRVQVDPLALHPELRALEDAGKYKFCWLPKPLTQKDRELLTLYHAEFGAAGKYVYVTRTNMEHELSENAADTLFSSSGAIEKGDLALGVMRFDVYNERRKVEREASVSQANRARKGHDAQGAIPRVEIDDGGGNFDFTVPGQPYMSEDGVEEAPELYSD